MMCKTPAHMEGYITCYLGNITVQERNIWAKFLCCLGDRLYCTILAAWYVVLL